MSGGEMVQVRCGGSITPGARPLTRVGMLWQLAIKECRQLLPLVAMLVGLAIFLSLVLPLANATSWNRNTWQTWQTWRTMLAFSPAVLFAVGAGSMSVGQEKESGSLAWLSWLPVGPLDLVIIKWMVSAGLVIVLLTAGTLWAPPSWNRFGLNDPSSSLSIESISLQAFLLLSTGMATAWAMQNTFASLVTIAPVAMMPWMISAVAAGLRPGTLPQTEQTWTKVLTCVLTLVMVGLVVWLGNRNLRGQTFGVWTGPRDTSPTREGFQPPGGRFDLWPAPVRDSLTAMTQLWWSHHRWFVSLIALMLVSSGLVWVIAGSGQEGLNWLGRYGLFLFAPLAPISAAWLGVAAHQGDGSSGGLKFLSDRGVSPFAIWLGRHLPPVTLLAGWSMLVFAISLLLRWGQTDRLPTLSLLGCVLSALVIYGISQFVAMVFRPLAASILLSMVLGSLGLTALAIAPYSLGTPLILILIAALVPWAASLMMISDYADDHRGPRFWSVAVAAILVFLLLVSWPVVPVSLRSNPVDADELTKWSQQASETEPFVMTRFYLPPSADNGLPNAPLRDVVQWSLRGSLDAASVLSVVTTQSLAAGPDFAALSPRNAVVLSEGETDNFLNHLSLWVGRLELTPDDRQVRQQTEAWFVGLGDVVAAARRGPSLQSQCFADVIEIELTRQLILLRESGVVDRDFARPLGKVLSDATLRHDGRRRGILRAWTRSGREMNQGTYDREFGRTEIAVGSLDTPGLWYWEKPHFIDQYTKTLLSLCDGGTPGQTDAALRRLHALNFGDELPFHRGPYGPKFRVNEIQSPPSVVMSGKYAGSHWSGSWEKLAGELFQSGEVVQ